MNLKVGKLFWEGEGTILYLSNDSNNIQLELELIFKSYF